MLTTTLIGCGGTMPLPGRALSALCVTVDGHSLLIDCGEGTQAAARRAGVSLYKVDAICLTHYHGDHIFGLPGLLQTMANLGRTAPVAVYGPAGLSEILTPILFLCRGLPFAVRPCELPESGFGEVPSLFGEPGLSLSAFPLRHRVRCCGYRVALARAGRFLPEKALALGVPQMEWKHLQRGESVAVGDRVVLPRQVLGVARRGLSVVYGCDTAPCEALRQAAAEADLLVMDATYAGFSAAQGSEADGASADTDTAKAALYGHSTFAQAARLAADAGAKRLWLTHYSAALTDPNTAMENAARIFPAAEAGFDGKTLELRFSNEGQDAGLK